MKWMELVEALSSIAVNYYMIAMVMVLLQCFFDEGIEWNKKKAHIIMIYCIVDNFVTYDNFWLQSGEYLLMVICMLYGSKGRYIRRGLLCAYTVFIVVVMYMSVLMMGLYYFFPDIYNLKTNPSLEYMEYAIMAAVMACFYYWMKRQYWKKGVHIRFGKRVYVFLTGYTIFLLAMYAMLSVMHDDAILEMQMQGVLVAFFIIFCLMFPVYLIKGQVSNHYQSRNEYQEIFLQEQLRTLERYKMAEEETRRIRHDMKNNLACISMLLQEGKLQEASDYTEGLLQDISTLSPRIVTGDEMLNCVFSAKLDWMQKENIAFEIDGVLDRGLDWKPIDVCRVFANAIDNAIEACMKIPDRDKRKISVSLKRTKQYYSIEMKNSIADKELCIPLLKNNSNTRYTTKVNKKFHGLGLSNMYRTVEKYGGMMKVDCQDQEFVLNIVV